MSLRGGVPTSTRCLTKVTLCGVLTHLPSLRSRELIHMGTTDGKHLVYQVEAVKSFGIHRRGQPLFTAGSPGIPLSPFSGCGGANGRKAAFPGTRVLAGNLRSHGTEGPRVLIKRRGLQLPASNRPFVQGTKWHLGPAITTTLSQRWLYGPCFLGHLSVEGKKDHRISRDTGEKPCHSDWSVWASGPALFQQTSRTDSQECSGRAKLVTANSGEEGRPTAGPRSGFCYTRARPVTVFAITTLASTQEHHPAAPCFSAKGEGKE